MGLWEKFKKFNYDIFCTEKFNEPAIAFKYDKDGKGNFDFQFFAFGSWIREKHGKLNYDDNGNIQVDKTDELEFKQKKRIKCEQSQIH